MAKQIGVFFAKVTRIIPKGTIFLRESFALYRESFMLYEESFVFCVFFFAKYTHLTAKERC